MTDTEEILENLKVVKRNGRKLVDFDGTKVAIAIKKGFDSVATEEESKYTEKDIQKVYHSVIKRISKLAQDNDKIKIENLKGKGRSIFKKERPKCF